MDTLGLFAKAHCKISKLVAAKNGCIVDQLDQILLITVFMRDQSYSLLQPGP